MNPKRGAESGTGGSGGSATPPTPPPTAASPTATPPTTAAPTDQPTTPPPPTPTPEGFVPVDQMRAVTRERDDLKRAADEAATAKAKEDGDWQALAETNEAKAKEAAERVVRVARRSAFIAAIAPQVESAEAAYKLAFADGLLSNVKIDNDDNADAEAIKAAVKTTLDAYKFLKTVTGSFGGERGGTQPESGTLPAGTSPKERMRSAYATTGRDRSG